MKSTYFYCLTCEDWTLLAPPEWGGIRCLRCGEDYQCGECGFEIDISGNCQRPEMTGEWCPSDAVPVS
jgi:hypothetical protein